MTLKEALKCAALAGLVAVLWSGSLLLLDARNLVKAQFDLEGRLAAVVTGQLNSLRTDTLARVDVLTNKTDSQITATRAQVLREVADWRSATQTELAATRDTVVGLGSKLDPVLASYTKLGNETTAAVKDLQDSWDDNYDDVKGLVASSTVAVTGIARAAEEVGKAAPQLGDAAVSLGKSGVRVGNAAAKEAEELTKPQSTRKKIMVWLELLPRIGLKLL